MNRYELTLLLLLYVHYLIYIIIHITIYLLSLLVRHSKT